MPRKLRLEYEGAIYHLMNRGDRKEELLLDDRDRQRFLETLGAVWQKTDWPILAYCPMRNDSHLRAETTTTWHRIGKQLAMGHWRTVANAGRAVGSKVKKRLRRSKYSISHL